MAPPGDEVSDARVVMGVPMYGDGRFLEEALESLSAQRFEDVRFMLVDDGLEPAAAVRAAAMTERDHRFHYRRNANRHGLLGNWRIAFHAAMEIAPGAEYFAWASDHDVWHPRFLSELVAHLDAAPDAVIAYPLRWVIDEHGDVDRFPGRFDTRDEHDPVRRFYLTNEKMSAGNLVYSVYRANALRDAGVYRGVLLPDRLLLLELALAGRFIQHPEVLWYRRTWANPTIARQRRTMWVSKPPLHTRLPWWLVHAAVFAKRFVLVPGTDPPVDRATGVRLVAATAWEGIRRKIRQRINEAMIVQRWLRWRAKKLIIRHVTMPLGAFRRRLMGTTVGSR
jgi:glycosyltransferase involved in cell wall biosynthesis